MSDKSKVVEIMMETGYSEDVLKCTNYNWTGELFKVNEININLVFEPQISGMRGIYILFYSDKENNQKYFTIGQSQYRTSGKFNLYIDGEKNNYNDYIIQQALVLQKINDTINDIEFNYMKKMLEIRMENSTKYINKSPVIIESDNLRKSKKEEIELFISKAVNIMGCLGFEIFRTSKLQEKYDNLFTLKREKKTKGQTRLIYSTAYIEDGKFIVLADSIAAKNNLKNINKDAKKLRGKRKDAFLKDYGGYKQFTRNQEFDDINIATQVVIGGYVNWRKEWVDTKGRFIGDLYTSDLKPFSESDNKSENKNSDNTIETSPKTSVPVTEVVDSKNDKKKNSSKSEKPYPNAISVKDYNTDVTYTKPEILIIDNTEYQVKNWADAVETLIKFLYNFDKETFYSLLNQNYFYLKITKLERQLNKPKKLNDELYFETCMNANAKIKFMYHLCLQYEIEDCVFYVLDEKANIRK